MIRLAIVMKEVRKKVPMSVTLNILFTISIVIQAINTPGLTAQSVVGKKTERKGPGKKTCSPKKKSGKKTAEEVEADCTQKYPPKVYMYIGS